MIHLTNNIFIPIGTSCTVTWYLNNNGYRKNAFPFDWTVTPIESAIDLINNGFKDFFNIKNLIFLKPTNRLLFKHDELNPVLTEDIITPVYDSKYNILYVHDFSKKGKVEYDEVKSKYARRVERMKLLLENKENKIYFIYDNSEPNDWQKNQYTYVNYQLLKLSPKKITELKISKSNAEIISLDEFKKREFIK